MSAFIALAGMKGVGEEFESVLRAAKHPIGNFGRLAKFARAEWLDVMWGHSFAGLHPPTPAVLVEVADDGPGIPEDLTDRIFNPFFTTKVTGTGLGLAIVRKIVDAHDGRIDLNSSPDTGTRFRVTLPVASASGWFK